MRDGLCSLPFHLMLLSLFPSEDLKIYVHMLCNSWMWLWFILHAMVQCFFLWVSCSLCDQKINSVALWNPKFHRKPFLNLSSPLIHAQSLLPSVFSSSRLFLPSEIF
jgi:hypothetical protein